MGDDAPPAAARRGWFRRVLDALVPDRYHGRRDRLPLEAQQDAMTYDASGGH